MGSLDGTEGQRLKLRRWVWPLLAVFVIAALAFAACGGDDDDNGGGGFAGPGGSGDSKESSTKATGGSTSGGGGSAASNNGSCEVSVTGDVSATWKGRGGASAVGSDYWYSVDEMKKIVGTLKSANESVDDAMKKDPRLYLLILNCTSTEGGGKNSISLFPSNSSKYKDVPFQPGEYVIPKQGGLGGVENPGEFGVLLSVGDGSFKVAEAGKLKITKFDKTGIAGTFIYKGEEGFAQGTPKKVSVEGKFDFACPAGDNCKK